jgi:hypothetical protein
MIAWWWHCQSTKRRAIGVALRRRTFRALANEGRVHLKFGGLDADVSPCLQSSEAERKTMAEDHLEAFIEEANRQCISRGYHPTVFQVMRQRHGTVMAISKLVESGEIQSGFRRLKELGIPGWSIEAAVVKFPDRFTSSTRECAEFRLTASGVSLLELTQPTLSA